MIMAFTVDVKAAFDFCSGDPVIAHSRICHSVNQHSNVWPGAGLILIRSCVPARENLTGSRVIRAFAKEPEEIEEFWKPGIT